MGKLNAEMKEMINGQVLLIATADGAGVPNIGPKGSFMVVDDNTLAYAELTAQKTLRNLKENSRVSVIAFDKENRDGYQFKGTSEILTEGDLFEKVAKGLESAGRPRPQYVVRVDIGEIYSVKPGKTATRIA